VILWRGAGLSLVLDSSRRPTDSAALAITYVMFTDPNKSAQCNAVFRIPTIDHVLHRRWKPFLFCLELLRRRRRSMDEHIAESLNFTRISVVQELIGARAPPCIVIALTSIQLMPQRVRIANTELTNEANQMPTTPEENTTDKLTREQWLQIRKEEGLKIDPDTAEVMWEYGYTLDPYGVYPDLPPECQQVGREYFARSPGSEIWVSFCDLPEETYERLWERHKGQLSFPAGLDWFPELCLRVF
jgi:hypothetical protein